MISTKSGKSIEKRKNEEWTEKERERKKDGETEKTEGAIFIIKTNEIYRDVSVLFASYYVYLTVAVIYAFFKLGVSHAHLHLYTVHMHNASFTLYMHTLHEYPRCLKLIALPLGIVNTPSFTVCIMHIHFRFVRINSVKINRIIIEVIV